MAALPRATRLELTSEEKLDPGDNAVDEFLLLAHFNIDQTEDSEVQEEGRQDPTVAFPLEWGDIINQIKTRFHTQGHRGKATKKEDAIELAEKLRNESKYKMALEWTAADGTSFLHYLFRDNIAVECCPPDVIKAIFRYNPESIERVVSGENDNIHPLTRAILGCNTAKMMDYVMLMIAWLNATNSKRQLENKRGEGRRCIEAAFEAMSFSNPISLFAVYTLLEWATTPMLPGIERKENLTPLHQAVVFDRCWHEPTHQPNLVRLLLKHYEQDIYDKVRPGTYRLTTGTITIQEPITVYEWHKRTAEKFKEFKKYVHQESQPTRNKSGQTPSMAGNQIQVQPDVNSTGEMIPNPKLSRRGTHNAGTQRYKPALKSVVNGVSNEHGTANQSRAAITQSKLDDDKEEQPTDGNKVKDQTYALPQRQQTDISISISKSAAMKVKKWDDALSASQQVLLILQESYLRSTIMTPKDGDLGEVAEMDETEIKQFFGGDMNNIEIGLHLGEQPRGEPIKEIDVREFFKNRDFSPILAYVSLPQAPITLTPARSKFAQMRYRDDRLFYFDWLRKDMKVKKILKVIVDDTRKPHRDDVIEEALNGTPPDKTIDLDNSCSFDVEILKWRKIDLDPRTILRAAPNTRELHLEWSGSNVALLGWSGLDGLTRLLQLRQVHLSYTQGNESSQRLAENINTFKCRLSDCRAQQNKLYQAGLENRAMNSSAQEGWKAQEANFHGPTPQQTQNGNESQAATNTSTTMRRYPDIIVFEHPKTEGGADAAPTYSPGRFVGPKHRWIKYMRDFVSLIPDLPTDMASITSTIAAKKVTVALIDDGVDVFTSDMAAYRDNILAGVSFDRSNDRHSHREWSSRSGHGTLMAKLILAVCPYANIIPYRVLMRPDKDTGTARPDPASAAKAIKDAVQRKVDIISMSWSVNSTSISNQDPKGFDRLRNIMSEASQGNISTPLLFCAAADDGIGSDNDKSDELPSNMNWRDLFCIGAATNALQTWVKVSSVSKRHFFFPGVDVPDLRQNYQYAYDSLDADPYSNSGSSIACALAAGQAALILHCVKLGIYYYQKMSLESETLRTEITEDHLKQMKQYNNMRNAFKIVCTENLSGQNVLYPAQRFEKVSEQMRKDEENGKSEWPCKFAAVAGLARNMMGWRDP